MTLLVSALVMSQQQRHRRRRRRRYQGDYRTGCASRGDDSFCALRVSTTWRHPRGHSKDLCLCSPAHPHEIRPTTTYNTSAATRGKRERTPYCTQCRDRAQAGPTDKRTLTACSADHDAARPARATTLVQTGDGTTAHLHFSSQASHFEKRSTSAEQQVAVPRTATAQKGWLWRPGAGG